MPNGKIGDHPITDILIHHRRVFTNEIDELTRAIVAAGGREKLDGLVDWFDPPASDELRRRLEGLRRALG